MLKAAGWRFIIEPTWNWNHYGMQYALDNGAWHAFKNSKMWDRDRFQALVKEKGDCADWIVAPDIVEGGLQSLERSLSWLDRLPGMTLLAMQDGIRPKHVRQYLSPMVGLFIGGSTEWKLATLPLWGQLARETGCYLHVGRVNTSTRIKQCQLAGAHSFDGSSAATFCRDKLPRLDKARRQRVLFNGQ
jgi:hypothetical protein